MSLHEVMQHPWVTCRGTAPLPTVAASGLQVSLRPAYVALSNSRIIQLFRLMLSQKSLCVAPAICLSMLHQLFTCLCCTSCLHVCAHVSMLHHAFFGSEGNGTLVVLAQTPQTNKFICVADSACDVARCQLCNQLSEPALSANPAVHLQGDPALSGPLTQTLCLQLSIQTYYFSAIMHI